MSALAIREIDIINRAVTAAGSILKVIFENDYLATEKIVKLCEICSAVAVAFVPACPATGWRPQHYCRASGRSLPQYRTGSNCR